MTRLISILILLFLAGSVRSQEPGYLDLVRSESLLQNLFVQLYSDSLSDNEPLLATILDIMPDALSKVGAMEFPWNGLNRIGVVTSDDHAVRVFTWHVMVDRDTYRYFGFIQVAMKKGKVKIYALKDNGKLQRKLTRLDQSPEDWYGKLYYNIVTNSNKRKTYYTLLGMDFNNTRSTLKTIEVISIQRNRPNFEKELFFDGRDNMDRLVFEYSSQVAISVRFDPASGLITMDHLVPFHPIYENNYEFYGPDGSYDGLEFVGGRWIFHQDIDARNLN